MQFLPQVDDLKPRRDFPAHCPYASSDASEALAVPQVWRAVSHPGWSSAEIVVTVVDVVAEVTD